MQIRLWYRLFQGTKLERVNESNARLTFADVAGIDNVKAEVMELVAFLRNPKRFMDLGAISPSGVLLVGGPGTGRCSFLLIACGLTMAESSSLHPGSVYCNAERCGATNLCLACQSGVTLGTLAIIGLPDSLMLLMELLAASVTQVSSILSSRDPGLLMQARHCWQGPLLEKRGCLSSVQQAPSLTRCMWA